VADTSVARVILRGNHASLPPMEAHARTARAPARGPVLAGVLVTLLLTVLVAVAAELSARAKHEKERVRRAEQHGRALEASLAGPVEALWSIPPLFASQQEITPSEFVVFVSPALTRHPALAALEFLPRVTAENRATMLEKAAGHGYTDFRITEPAPDGSMREADVRDESFVIYFMQPLAPAALGFDIASDPVRLGYARRAIDSGRVVVSQRFRLVEDPEGVHSVALYAPSYWGAPPAGAPREASVRGLAVALFRLRPALDALMPQSGDVDLALFDRSTSNPEAALLYESRPGFAASSADAVAYTFPFGDRTWEARIAGRTPPPALATATLLLSLGGVLVSILVGWVVHTLGSMRRLRRQVQDALTLGQYTLVQKIGEGGMGAVYRANHALLRRPTAIKLVTAAELPPAQLARFEREIRSTSQLTHPNTIAVYDFGHTPGGVFYYAMEFIDGLSLQALVSATGPLPPARVIHLLQQIAAALAEAHAAGLVHRDVKPANVMLSHRGGIPDFVKVIDFGLVKDNSEDGAATRADPLLGTPLYLAPEAMTNPTGVGPGVDVYALGALAYQLLTGAPPFGGATVMEICSQHLSTPPVPPSLRSPGPIPAELEALVLQCLAKDPAARPADASVVEARLTELARLYPWPRAEAERWWHDTGRALVRSTQQTSETSSSAHTLAIDLLERRPGGTST
jgi:serine/threonine protein kinase/CHASE1-domain containing sensor protein